MAIAKTKDNYTYKDYASWPDEERWEIIEGVPYDMSPAPSRRHQEISIEIARQLSDFLLEKSCQVFAAPFDVILPETNEITDAAKTVVQPDIVVVCDKKKLEDKGCVGAPDIIMEILSPQSASRDLKDKLELYERFGVKEYAVIEPNDEIVMLFRIGSNSRYGRPDTYGKEDKVSFKILSGFSLDLNQVFRLH